MGIALRGWIVTEDRQQIIAPDIAPDDAQATAERLRKWLRDRGSLHEARGVAVPADLLGPGFVATPYGSELPGCNPL